MAAKAPKETNFAEATAVKQLSSHIYEASFRDDWCIGKVPHGGYVTSIFLQVASAHFKTTLKSQNQPHTIALHLDFLRRTEEGPAFFTVRDVKLGRQTSIIHISLAQPTSHDVRPPFTSANSREEVVGYITNSNITTESGITLNTEYKLYPPVLPVNLLKLREDKDEHWARQGSMPFASFRKASQKVQFHFPRKGQPMRSISDEWCCFTNGEKFTNAALGYVADMFPMPVENFRADKSPYDVSADGSANTVSPEAKFWYPTLLLNLDIKKALPEEGVEWIFARVRPKQIKNGRMDLEVIIMDENGELVALSHHVCFVLGAERNTAKRRNATSNI